MGKHKVDLIGLDLNKYPALSMKEMEELFKEYKKGSAEAKEKLIKGNFKLVLSLLKNYSDRVDNLDDLFQIGCIGLIKAIDNFDISLNLKFSTYAVPMISGEIKRYLRDNTPIRVSRQIKDLAYKILKERETYLNEHGYEPNVTYYAKKFSVSEYEVKEALDSTLAVSSLFSPVKTEKGDNLCLIDQISDENSSYEKQINRYSLQRGLEKLSQEEKNIIFDRYYRSKTQFEIATELGVSQAQISRIEKIALKTLKSYF